MRLIRDGEKVGGEGVWIWRKREVDFADNIFQLDIYKCYIMLVQRFEPQGRRLTNFHYYYYYTVTTRMTPALRWAAMRAILVFH